VISGRITEFDQAKGYTHKKNNSELLLEKAGTVYNSQYALTNGLRDKIISELPPI
jgi:hypothetical protein